MEMMISELGEIPQRLFFKIGDVAELVGVKPYVLRYWETEFPMISPQKSDSGQRVYRRADVEIVLIVKKLLYQERYSIEGARKRIKELRAEVRSGQSAKAEAKASSREFSESAEMQAARKAAVKRAQSLTRELKKLSQTPINKLFSL
jgi:DNA-binding transcriptional MerR regulator